MKYWLHSPWCTDIFESIWYPVVCTSQAHSSTPFVPSHPPLLAMSLFSRSVSLFLLYLLVCFIFYTTHVISYSICLSLSDISLSIIRSKSIHVRCLLQALFHSFLWLSHIPFSLSLSLSLSIYIYTHTHHTFSFSLYISVFFIHSSVDGHLSCFYILAIMNNAMNINAHVSLHVSVFVLVIYPEVEMLGHAVVLDFSF